MKNLCLLLCFAGITLDSCQRDLYIPDHIYAPTFARAGVVDVDVSTRLQRQDQLPHGESGGWSFSADAAYAFTNHFGVFVSCRDILNKAYIPASKYYPGEVKLLNGQRYDIAAGYYNQDRTGFVFSAFGGFGNGNLQRSGSLKYGNYDLRYNRLFAQILGGFGNDIAWFLTGMKCTAQRYYDFSSFTRSLGDSLLVGEQLNINKQTVLFAEPFIEGRVGHKNVHFTTQLGISAQMGGVPVSDFLFLPPYLTIGIDFNIGVGKKGKLPEPRDADDGKK